MSTETATTRAFARAGAGPTRAHTEAATDGDGYDGQNEPASDQDQQVFESARKLRLASLTMWTMRASSVSEPDVLGTHRERPSLVERAAGNLTAGELLGRDRIHRSALIRRCWSCRRWSGPYRPEPWLPGLTRSTSPATTPIEADSSSVPSGLHPVALPPSRLSRSLMALDVFDRARNSSTWPSNTRVTITDAASKYKRQASARCEKHLRQPFGKENGVQAEENKRPKHPSRSKREHVELPGAEGTPAALQERPAGPKTQPVSPAPPVHTATTSRSLGAEARTPLPAVRSSH